MNRPGTDSIRYLVWDAQKQAVIVEGDLQQLNDCFGIDVNYMAGDDITEELMRSHVEERGWWFYRLMYDDEVIAVRHKSRGPAPRETPIKKGY